MDEKLEDWDLFIMQKSIRERLKCEKTNSEFQIVLNGFLPQETVIIYSSR